MSQQAAPDVRTGTGENITSKVRMGQIKFTNALPICHFIDNDDPMVTRVPGAPNELHSSGMWRLAEADRFHNLRQATEMTRLRRGVGLPGRV
ncbi:MAG: hypothetical protein ACXVDJ_00505, partial [Tumebacillaceae bacterium]